MAKPAETLMGDVLKCFDSGNHRFIREESGRNGLLQLHVAENCLCASLMVFLREEIKYRLRGYYVDVDYFPIGNEAVAPEATEAACDLCIHGRGSADDHEHLLALDIVLAPRPYEDKEASRRRLCALTRGAGSTAVGSGSAGRGDYLVGILYEIDMRKREIRLEYFQEGEALADRWHPLMKDLYLWR